MGRCSQRRSTEICKYKIAWTAAFGGRCEVQAIAGARPPASPNFECVMSFFIARPCFFCFVSHQPERTGAPYSLPASARTRYLHCSLPYTSENSEREVFPFGEIGLSQDLLLGLTDRHLPAVALRVNVFPSEKGRKRTQCHCIVGMLDKRKRGNTVDRFMTIHTHTHTHTHIRTHTHTRERER